ncbi:signal transducer and activator of transcription B [Drosophila novamexicana]|uniref:signal transducer and activator of transcription B n=1 Tax=Drosophila novamexicana TaxID=47314 RepID=UPI0011E5EAE0|nr:signal transducer and activator of transcription B [Drosophila novamexicana]XP_030568672.1 signal transducer and activator of transcription B [Drosophila novamexicana]
MSYQIKRTPYFRRMFNNSRRNGQLQRLREEYERIQEFNDRTIELKMRQVRLKRLFREIEDINESPSTSNAQRRHTTLVHLTPEAIQAQQRRERLEALERARELGQEISRRNAQMAESGAGFYLRSELRLTAKMRAVDDARREAQERRQRAARRISYGNAQSRSNIERIVQRRQRRLVTGDSAATSIMLDTSHHQAAQLPQSTSSHNQLHPDLMKRAMLQQRLQYGNSRSSNNMMRSQLAAAHRVMNCLSATDTLTDETDQLQQQQQLQQRQQLQMQLDHREQPLTVAHFSPSSTSNNIVNNNSSNNNNNNNKSNKSNNIIVDSETEMQTAMLPPTEPDMMRNDDVPTTSQNALRLADVTTAMAATITDASQPPLAAARSNIMLHETKSDRASQRWHRIQLTLPWIKVMHDRPLLASSELPAGQLPIGGDELGNNNNNSNNIDNSNNNNNNNMNINNSYYNHNNNNNNSSPTGTGATDNYQSIRGPSLMQEDLMQIMELDNEGQLPTMHAHCIHQAFGQ